MSRLRASYHAPKCRLVIPTWMQSVDMTDVAEKRDCQRAVQRKFEQARRMANLTSLSPASMWQALSNGFRKTKALFALASATKGR